MPQSEPNSNEIANLKHDKDFTISSATTRTAKRWKNSTITVLEFARRLSSPVVTAETYEEFMQMTKAEQDHLKDCGGYVLGSLKNGLRRRDCVANRSALSFDIDYARADTLERIKTALKDVCFTIHSTRKHKPGRPRYRLIVYPDQSMLPDQFEPVARKIAERTDIELYDPSGFRINQFMYYPSVSSDSDYVFFHNDKPFLQVDKVLAAYGPGEAWQDVTTWPTSSRETQAIQRLLKKQADPLTKRGIVGAFARHVSIYDALEQLSDVYKKEGPDRYTYREGSSSKGLVVYDGKFAFSNHSTDPAHGQTCNAFDLIRIHRYGHMDENIKADTPAHRIPSYKEMSAYARSIKEVKIELVAEGIDLEPGEFDEFDEGKVGPGGKGWFSKVQAGENGQTKPTFYNAYLIVSNDPALNGRMRKNEFSIKVENTATGKTWSDEDSIDVRVYVGQKYKVDFPEKKIEDAITMTAEINSYHPVQDYLTSLTWDGVERIETLFIDYMRCEDNIYTREIAKCWFTAAVNRVFWPGYKFDTAIVLSGVQGVGKTTFIRELGRGKWYGELTSFDSKIAMEEIVGKWIIEINEMGATNKQELEQQKSFLSAQHTTVRMAYARHPYDFQRQCVFMGSTNQTEYLKDSTGNRRWWPIDIGIYKPERIDIDRLQAEIDQIWAEAYVLHVQGANTFLSDEAEAIADRVQEEKLEADPWEGIIGAWLEEPAPVDRYDTVIGSFSDELEVRDRVCTEEIWRDCLGYKTSSRPSDRKRITAIMDRKDLWERVSTIRFGVRFGRQRGWKKDTPF